MGLGINAGHFRQVVLSLPHIKLWMPFLFRVVVAGHDANASILQRPPL